MQVPVSPFTLRSLSPSEARAVAVRRSGEPPAGGSLGGAR